MYRTKDELWTSIKHDYVLQLVASMRRRIHRVGEEHGSSAEYRGLLCFLHDLLLS